MPRESFIPNDVRFTEAERVLLVTGPNMAGKSTILRQIGLCVVLAQIGRLRARGEAASIGVVDRLFTRVGASDNLARGQSTFMVEMSETSAILHNATDRSLVLLDEIGRGTSTYDGVAIAWAVTEHLHDRVGCKTMFATHYHELMQLPERLAARPELQRGGPGNRGDGGLPAPARAGRHRPLLRHSRGPAGRACPAEVVRRAREILGTLEGEHRMVPGPPPPLEPDPGQLGLFADASAPRSRGRGAQDPRPGHPHPARGPEPAGRLQAAGLGGPWREPVPRAHRPGRGPRSAGLAGCTAATTARCAGNDQPAAPPTQPGTPPVAINPVSPMVLPTGAAGAGNRGPGAAPALRGRRRAS